MSTVARPPSVAVVSSREIVSGETIVLRHVSWSMYCALRDEEANNHVLMTYDRGKLELMAPARRHERAHKLLARMVQAWTEERNIPISSGGQTTLRREDLERGVEPDESFHIQHEADVRSVDELVLPDYPPPDLVIEADVTHSSVPRLPIFASLGVPEVWRWKNDTLQVLCLDGGEYAEQSESRVLPGFPFAEALRLIAQRKTMNETELMRAFRQSIRKAASGEAAD